MSQTQLQQQHQYTPNSQTKPSVERQPFIMIVVGMTGVGKTYAIIQEIIAYVRDNLQTGKMGRPAYVFDTNFEPQYAKMFPRTADKETLHQIVRPECRRILPYNEDGTVMDDAQMREMAEWLTNNARDGMLVLDDIDKYYRGSKARSISKLFMGHRHIGLDVVMTHQSLSPIQPISFENCTMIRLHKTVDNVDRISDRVPNYPLLKIAQLIVDEQFQLAEDLFRHGKIGEDEWKKRRSYFVYVNIRTHKIIGAYSKKCFRRNAKKFILLNKKMIKDHMEMHMDDKTGESKFDRGGAIDNLIDQLEGQYYAGKE